MLSDDFTEKIELLVNDESRIVTYKALSQELKIHVNKAKLFLMEFMNAQKSKGVNLEVHYFLAGFSETSGLRSVKVLIVSEDNLEKAKEGFTELTSCHIYSIFKGISKDECALYSADFCYTKNIEDHNKYSAIKHPNIEIQPPVLNKMQVNKDEKKNFSKKEPHGAANGSLTAAVSKKVTQVQSADNISPEQDDTSKVDNLTKESEENKSSSGDKKQKPGTLMSMWEKKEQSNGVKKEIPKAGAKGKETAKNVPKNNILSMFSKQAVKNSEKPTSKPVSNVETPKNDVAEVVRKDNSPKNVQSSENKKSSQKRKASKKQPKASKSKRDSDSDSELRPKAKKHRRICMFDDSSSESEPEEEKEKAQRSFFLPEEPLDIVPATPVSGDESEDFIPPTPPVVRVKGKAKVWKTVQKTYEDEDGFFVTKNEKELVSASEDEEDPLKDSKAKEIKTKKNEKVEKKIPAVNKKQASLMSFFKQK